MSARTAAIAWEALFRAQVSVMRQFEMARDFAPLRAVEYDVLFNLARLGGRARQGELNQTLLITQPSLSRMIDRLSGQGYLRRQHCDSDGRGVVVVLTDEGRLLQERIGRRHVRHIAQIIDDALSTDDQEQLAVLADAVRRRADAPPAGVGAKQAAMPGAAS